MICWEIIRVQAVVINPTTGAIIAMASTPSFDPNTVNADWDSFLQTLTAQCSIEQHKVYIRQVRHLKL